LSYGVDHGDDPMNLTLPPLLDGDIDEYRDELPQVLPRFFIPRLQDKPQDPIMDALRIERESRASRHELSPPELVIISEANLQESSQGSPEEDLTLFWERAAKEGVRVQVSLIIS
jgi:hypothetical protein